MKRYQKMAALFSIVWMVMIFCFSAQPSDDSGEVSGGVTETLVTTANFLFHWEMDQSAIMERVDKWEGTVRKIAHATEFFLLTMGLFLWLDCRGWTIWKHLWIAGCIAVGYAVSDEFHQLFVPGRAGRIGDVGVDSIGVLVALLLMVGVRVCISSLWKKDKSVGTESSSQEKM